MAQMENTERYCGQSAEAPPLRKESTTVTFLRKTGAVRVLRKFKPLVLGFIAWAGVLLRPYIVSRYLRANKVRKLQLGAGYWLLPGWLNSDLRPLAFGCVAVDATARFPFDSGCFDYVFSEHQMEHIEYQQAANMLRECHRILRPGGKIRIAVPSMEPLLALAAPPSSPEKQKYITERTALCYPAADEPNACFAINATFMNWGHRFLYDRRTLSHLLERNGYTDVRFFRPGESDDANLAGIEARVSETDMYDVMVAQALRV
jgi:predicted SAM-dependent methyltransferase